MKKTVMTIALGFVFCFGTFAHDKVENKKVNEKQPKTEKESKAVLPPQQEWRYVCSDGKVTEFTCGCTQAQATAMGQAWCNSRGKATDSEESTDLN